MPKLKVQLIPKCPKCGKQMQQTIAHWQGYKAILIYCPNSRCRYAEYINMDTGEKIE